MRWIEAYFVSLDLLMLISFYILHLSYGTKWTPRYVYGSF